MTTGTPTTLRTLFITATMSVDKVDMVELVATVQTATTCTMAATSIRMTLLSAWLSNSALLQEAKRETGANTTSTGITGVKITLITRTAPTTPTTHHPELLARALYSRDRRMKDLNSRLDGLDELTRTAIV